jgi:hypothetical protein
MDFVNRLRPEHLRAFWYFPSQVSFALIGTFGSLLLATSPCQEELDFYKTRLGEYRWTLSVSSRNAAFLSFAVETLDGFEDLLKNLPKKPQTSEITPAMQIRAESNHQDIQEDDSTSGQFDQLSLLIGLPQPISASGLISPSASTESESIFEGYDAYQHHTHHTL